jgi:hypothetical protein
MCRMLRYPGPHVGLVRSRDSPSAAIDNDLITSMATRIIALQASIQRLECYVYHAPDCAVYERYPCTCGLERMKP